MASLVLHNYFRSSTSIRVRVALNLKRLDYAYVAHHLRLGEHRGEAYRAVNRQMLVPSLESALAEVAARSVADDVRAALSCVMNGERPSVEKVARALRTSVRTLQRRLGQAGTSYQVLLDDVRRDFSRRLLASTDLDASEIAFLLGFEELNSFSRAFHGWEGVTPTRWREARHVVPG